MKLIRYVPVMLLASACSREPAVQDQVGKTQPASAAVEKPSVPDQKPETADRTPPEAPKPPRPPKALPPDERPVGTTAATIVDGKAVNTDALVMADFKQGLRTLPFYMKYLGAVRWLFHGQFSGQDKWMVEVTDAPPEKLYRPDDSLLQWRRLAQTTTDERMRRLRAQGIEPADTGAG